jgi:hypothetical protein
VPQATTTIRRRDAGGGLRVDLVVMVLRRIERLRDMALRTKGVALGDKARAMRLVAVAAHHARGCHLALQEGAQNVHLGLLPSVRPIETVVQKRWHKAVQHR